MPVVRGASARRGRDLRCTARRAASVRRQLGARGEPREEASNLSGMSRQLRRRRPRLRRLRCRLRRASRSHRPGAGRCHLLVTGVPARDQLRFRRDHGVVVDAPLTVGDERAADSHLFRARTLDVLTRDSRGGSLLFRSEQGRLGSRCCAFGRRHIVTAARSALAGAVNAWRRREAVSVPGGCV